MEDQQQSATEQIKEFFEDFFDERPNVKNFVIGWAWISVAASLFLSFIVVFVDKENITVFSWCRGTFFMALAVYVVGITVAIGASYLNDIE